MENNTDNPLKRDIIRALRQVFDPEIPVNIYDLGLVYDIAIDNEHNVVVKMTLTAPNCPVADQVVEEAREAVAETPGVCDVRVELVFEPQWSKEMMSEAALLELGFL